MSTHPHDSLADYVDGALDAEARAAVDAHLRSCQTCAAEVDAATAARAALTGLPDVDPPAGIIADTIDSLPRDSLPDLQDRRRKRAARFTALAAAAAVVLVFVIALPSFMGARSRSTSMEAAAPQPAAAPSAQTQAAVDLQGLAVAERDRYAAQENITIVHEDAEKAAPPADTGAEEAPQDAAVGTSPPAATEEGTSGTSSEDLAWQGAARGAAESANQLGLREVPASTSVTRCLRSSEAFSQGGELLRVFEGDATGTASYYAVLLEGPRASDTPDRVVIWVADRSTCEAVGYAQAYLVYPTLSSPPPGYDFP